MAMNSDASMQGAQPSSAANAQDGSQMQIRVPQDLEYVYRDVFNVFGGPGEVILELGNQHRSVPNQASISNRIVLSFQTAARLQQALTKTLVAVQEKVREQNQQQPEAGNTGN